MPLRSTCTNSQFVVENRQSQIQYFIEGTSQNARKHLSKGLENIVSSQPSQTLDNEQPRITRDPSQYVNIQDPVADYVHRSLLGNSTVRNIDIWRVQNTMQTHATELEKTVLLEMLQPDGLGELSVGRHLREAPNTCRWLTLRTEYRDWLKSSESSLLWMEGPIGCGKTVLVNFLAKELKLRRSIAPSSVVVPFFCSGGDEATQSSTSLIRVILYHLVLSTPAHKIPRPSMPRTMDFTALFGVYKEIARVSERFQFYFLLDAFDECTITSQEDFLDFLEDVGTASATDSNVCFKTLVSSRRGRRLRLLASEIQITKLEIDRRDSEHDVALYVHTKLQSLLSEGSSKRNDLQQLFERKAEGKFQWAALMVKHLGTHLTADFQTALEGYPPGLTEMYRTMLAKIPSRHNQVARDMLQWVMVALRPLRLQELSLAVSIQEGDTNEASLHHREFSEEDVREVLGAFAKVEDGLVSMDHQSAREFLLRDSKGREFLRGSRPPDAGQEQDTDIGIPIELQTKAAETCIRYLLFDDFKSVSIDDLRDESQVLETLLMKHRFLQYSSNSTATHFKESRESLQVRNLFFQLLETETTQPALWLRLYFFSVGIFESTRGWTALHICAYFDLKRVIETMLSSEWSLAAPEIQRIGINVPDSMGLTALHLATKRGNKEIVGILLQNGADPNLPSQDRKTALHLAMRVEKATFFRSLEIRDIVPESENKNLTSPSIEPVTRETEEIVTLLLGKGADVKAVDDDGWSSIHCAAASSNRRILQLLLEKGADIEAETDNQLRPLHFAAQSGSEAVIELLLEKGAKIDVQEHKQWNPLHFAAQSGSEAVVKLLLEEGADIEAEEEDQWRPLHFAAQSGSEAIVKLLLEKGALLDARTAQKSIPLHIAAGKGNWAVAKLLLEEGADIEAETDNQLRPLHFAAQGGSEAVVKLLLEKGALSDARTAQKSIPLHIAAGKGNWAVAKLLLEEGADIEAEAEDQWRPLHFAAQSGSEAVVKLLLEKGAKMDVQEHKQWNPLHFAAQSGSEAVVKLLLEEGADIEAEEEDQWRPLHFTAQSGSEAILLEEGADIEAETDNQLRPLHFAWIPPIGTNYLMHHYNNLSCIDAEQTWVYSQVPKKINEQLIGQATAPALGWGIHLEEGWHWDKIWNLGIALFILGSLMFSVLWAIFKKDIQGAFGISSFWTSIFAIVLAYVAARKV